jgi:hypothetical protein
MRPRPELRSGQHMPDNIRCSVHDLPHLTVSYPRRNEALRISIRRGAQESADK